MSTGHRQSQLRIREMVDSDLSWALQLSDGAGWNQTAEDWQRLLAFAPSGCFLAEWDSEPVGTVTTTVHDDRLGWIGMMLVHPNYQRRGIATQLMQRAIEELQRRKMRWIGLDATPAGQKVYERLGFAVEFELNRWQRPARDALPPSPPLEIPFSLTPELNCVDEAAFGVDRRGWLEQLSRSSRSHAGSGAFGMLRGGTRADYLGPVSARTADVARSVIDALLKHAEGPVFWDIPVANRPAEQFARELGFAPVRSLVRMRLGSTPLPGDPCFSYAISGPETG